MSFNRGLGSGSDRSGRRTERRRGQKYTIHWSYSGNPGPYVKIDLFKNGVLNKNLARRVAIGTGGAGSFVWTISTKQTLGTDYRIRVTSTTNEAYTDTSDANFSIIN